MAITKYNPNGGAITVSPIMQGPMNCGYTLDAYKNGSITPFLSISGDIENIHPMTFESAANMGENTRIVCSFSYRAGNDSLVGSKFQLGIAAKQDGAQLSDQDLSDDSATLSADVQIDQYQLIMKSN